MANVIQFVNNLSFANLHSFSDTFCVTLYSGVLQKSSHLLIIAFVTKIEVSTLCNLSINYFMGVYLPPGTSSDILRGIVRKAEETNTVCKGSVL